MVGRAVAIALALVAATPAHAVPRVDPRLHIDDCDLLLDARELRRLLQIELRHAAVNPEVHVRCDLEEAAAQLTVGDREERVALGAVRRPARTRALALLAVEALRRARAPEPKPEPAPEPEPKSASASEPEPEPKPDPLPAATATKTTPPPAPPLTPAKPNRRRIYGGVSLGLFLGSVGTYALAGTFAGLSSDTTRSDAGSMRTAGLSLLGVGTATVLGSAVLLGFYIKERRRK